MKKSIVQEKAFYFALLSLGISKLLRENKEWVFANQFLKSSTSIGANINEALASYSRKEFAAKMSIASKEARETLYWIELMDQGKLMKYDFTLVKEKASELVKMLTSIVKTTQTKN